jgi:hypothetical protein
MRTRLSLGLVFALVLGGISFASVPVEAQTPFPDFGQIPPTVLAARMTGGAEVPGPGDADGLGFAAIVVLAEQRMVCYVLRVTNIATPTAAHIHRGSPTQAGPIVLPLDTPVDGMSSSCATSVDAGLIAGLKNNPRDYYVNVHNATYPNGAIRGQLARITDSLPD